MIDHEMIEGDNYEDDDERRREEKKRRDKNYCHSYDGMGRRIMTDNQKKSDGQGIMGG